MKSNCVFFNVLMLAVPVTLWLQGSALAQAYGTAGTPSPPAVIAALQEKRNAQETNTSVPAPAALFQRMVDERRRAETNTAAATFQQNVDFYFPGGRPRDFISAVDHQYKVDWAKVADIPAEIAFGAHIPALRMNRQSAEHILAARGNGAGGGFRQAGTESERNPFDALIALYNSVATIKPELGQLTVEGDLAKPSVVLFQSRLPSESSDFKMKAFALNGIPENEWHELRDIMLGELDSLATEQAPARRSRVDLAKPRVDLYKGTGLLIVHGPESILEVAESLVTAWRSKHAPVTTGLH